MFLAFLFLQQDLWALLVNCHETLPVKLVLIQRRSWHLDACTRSTNHEVGWCQWHRTGTPAMRCAQLSCWWLSSGGHGRGAWEMCCHVGSNLILPLFNWRICWTMPTNLSIQCVGVPVVKWECGGNAIPPNSIVAVSPFQQHSFK